MKDDDSHRKPAPDDPEERSAAEGLLHAANSDQRRDPVFTDFDEDTDYEESERDTDYASAYEDEEIEDDEREEALDEDDPDDAAWQVSGGEPRETDSSLDAGGIAWAARAAAQSPEQDSGMDTVAARLPADPDLFDGEEDDYLASDDEDTEWEDREEYPDEPGELETTTREESHGWPLGLILVGLLALVLLAAGGYGVIQQRSAAQEEIRQLQAALATAASPADVAATREALRQTEQQNEANLAKIAVLEMYNKRLTDTVAGLEQQLAAQQAEAPRVEEPIGSPSAAPASAPDAKPAAAEAAPDRATPDTTSADGGDWFVNFSSYSQRGAAETWLKKLSPEAGEAVITPVEIDGKTLYRLRIVGLADRAQAEKVAGKLQSAHELPPLWVGQE